MNKIDLGRGTIIYYDIESKIIGRKPTVSNLKEYGSDNSLYMGLIEKKSQNIICSIFNVENIDDFSNKKYNMNFYGEEIEVECNINKEGQLQLKVLGEGHMYYLLSKYERNVKEIENKDNLVILLNFENMEILFDEINGGDLEYEPNKIKKEKHDMQYIVDQCKIIAKDKNLNLDGYIETQLSVRNSKVQRRFRDNLLVEFNGRCAICGIDKKELLRASHILPYSKCPTVEEMIDYNNGILLCVTHDELFDKKYISFDYYTGNIMIANESILEKKLYPLLNISENMKLDKKFITEKRIKYLATHKIKEK